MRPTKVLRKIEAQYIEAQHTVVSNTLWCCVLAAARCRGLIKPNNRSIAKDGFPVLAASSRQSVTGNQAGRSTVAAKLILSESDGIKYKSAPHRESEVSSFFEL